MLALILFTNLLAMPQGMTDLQVLAQKAQEAVKETDFAKRAPLLDEVQNGVLDLVAKDKLVKAAELSTASHLLNTYPFESAQVKYELMLAALASGDEQASKLIAAPWDNLLVTMSRGRRLGIDKMPGGPGMARYQLHATAKGVIAVYRDPATAIINAKQAKDNAEVQTIVDADQKAREQDWSKLTMKDYERIAKDDFGRLNRVKQIVNSGALKTANDFGNAGLVCQHGETFEDYALAHELSVCAVILGKKSESWLAGASYDRMLFNSGYPQRFATQYSINAGVTKLSRVETQWINDTERKAVVGKTLKEAQDRKWE